MHDYVRTMTAAELSSKVGQDMGVSDWFEVSQPKVDAFANLTDDSNFVHVDPVRARQTPFGGTIAHGFLTVSILAWMGYQVCPRVADAKVNLNYGFNRLRFLAPVPVPSRIRGRFKLAAFEGDQRGCQSTYDVTVEIENATKPALVAQWIIASVI
jgi:acyl dehydratase